MTTGLVISLIAMGFIKILLTCLPSSVAGSIFGKFELHPKLTEADVTVTFDGRTLEGEDKTQVIHHFNEALFLEQYDFLPQKDGAPVIIDMKRGKNDVRFFVYSYNDRVDVFKQYKKKVVAYCLRSPNLQKQSTVVSL
ncbi:hypothetical protein JQN58_20260 [Aneurinibacillus sp. BA2021]|nr:hypothetical protein [Aneurinibacillus sp. BA2021]